MVFCSFNKADLCVLFRVFKDSNRGVAEPLVIAESVADVPRPEELRQRRARFLHRNESQASEPEDDPAEFEPFPEDFIDEESEDDADSDQEAVEDVEHDRAEFDAEMARKSAELDSAMDAEGELEEFEEYELAKRQRVQVVGAEPKAKAKAKAAPKPKAKTKAAPKPKAKAKAKATPRVDPATLSLPEGVASELDKLCRGGTYEIVFYGGRFPGTARTVTVRSVDAKFVWVYSAPYPAGADGEVHSYSKHLVGSVSDVAGVVTRSRARRKA